MRNTIPMLAILGLSSLVGLYALAQSTEAPTPQEPAGVETPAPPEPAAAEAPASQEPAAAEAPASQEPAAAATPAPLPDPVAVVNGQPISKDLYETYAQVRQRQVGDVSSPQVRQALTEELVVQELLVQEAEKENLRQNPEVAMQLQLAERNLLANAAVRKQLESFSPDEATVKQEYDTLAASMGGKEYKARHILVESEDKAKSLIEELNKGADFSELAKTNSTDSSAAGGGDLGWFTTDMMVQPFGATVTQLEKGKYTEAPVQTQFGWHVIVLDDVRDVTPPPLEELRPQISQMLQGRMINDYLAKLREQAQVEIK